MRMMVVGSMVLLAGCGENSLEEGNKRVLKAGVEMAEGDVGLAKAQEPQNHKKLCELRNRLAVAYMKAGRAEDQKRAEAEAAKECASAK